MSSLIVAEYGDMQVSFQDDGWFNATAAAAVFGKRVDRWLENKETCEYIAALCEISNTRKSGYLKTKRGQGGGTWLHPDLAINFARWLDVRFAIWCDMQIKQILTKKTSWVGSRHQAASSYKMQSTILQMIRSDAGKATDHYHYMNEAKLVNWSLTGEFKSVDREKLSIHELDLLAYLEERNAIMIGRGLSYEQRKPMLKHYAMDWQMSRELPILEN